MTGFTMRCGTCDVSWPHHPKFRVCEICGYDTEPKAALEHDHVLTMAEADELLIERGVKEAPPGGIMSSNYKPRVSSMRQPPNPEAPELVRQLREDFDRWAKEAPSWLT